MSLVIDFIKANLWKYFLELPKPDDLYELRDDFDKFVIKIIDVSEQKCVYYLIGTIQCWLPITHFHFCYKKVEAKI